MKKEDIFILRDFENFSSVTDIIKSRNLSFHNKVIEQSVIEANYTVSKQLNVPLATKLFYLKKIRIVEGRARSIEKVYIDLKEVKGMEDLDFNDVSFYSKLYEIKGINALRSQEEIMIVKANDEERKMLQLGDQKEILLIKGVSFVEGDKPFEYFEISSDPKFYRFRSVSKL